METNSNTYKTSKKHIWRKRKYLFLFFPLVVYAVLTSLNNAFGIDLTLGLMGDREPVGAGYTVLLFLPFYLVGLAKGTFELFVRRPRAITLSPTGFVKHTTPKRSLSWSDIKLVRTKSEEGIAAIEIVEKSGRETRIQADELDAALSDLITELGTRNVRLQRS